MNNRFGYIYKNNKYKKKNIFCGNCGKHGHMYKECRQPIISLGIILFRMNNGVREYLLIMRKDTLGYVELIRGNYPINDLSYLQNIIEEMTISEKERILNETFETLWNNLWVENEEKKIKYRNEFYKSMINFKKINEGFMVSGDKIKLNELIKTSYSQWEEPEWGFPKGRRNLRENDINCALREFEEETDIQQDEISVMKDIEPFVEEFVGSNNKIYKHIYYLAEMTSIKKPLINQEKAIQMIEIGDIKWFPIKEAISKIRQYDIAKKQVLIDVDKYLDKYYSKIGESHNNSQYYT
jgi:8-oxo-dGTP pyrophosphatase MutT (NUDIX family)